MNWVSNLKSLALNLGTSPCEQIAEVRATWNFYPQKIATFPICSLALGTPGYEEGGGAPNCNAPCVNRRNETERKRRPRQNCTKTWANFAWRGNNEAVKFVVKFPQTSSSKSKRFPNAKCWDLAILRKCRVIAWNYAVGAVNVSKIVQIE